jgi:CspA family cold shock protein
MKSKGVVVWFSERKGFGFIQAESGEDFFVHYKEIRRKGFKTLDVGERVRFDPVDEDSGKKAANVEVLEN